MAVSRLIGLCAAISIGATAGSGAQTRRMQAEPTTVPGSRPAAVRITLEDAAAMAVRNSKALQSAAEAVHRARGAVNERRTAFLPTVSSDATFTRLDEGVFADLPIGPDGSNVRVPFVQQNQKSVSVLAAVPIDIMGQIAAAVSAADYQLVAARLDYNRVRNGVVSEAKSAYYDVLRASAFVAVAEQALRNAQARQSTAEAFLRAGAGTRFDVLRAQTDVANAQQSLIATRNRVSLATAALNNALNIDQNTPTEVVSETLSDPGPAPDFDAAVGEAYRQRPEPLQAEAYIAAARKGLVLARRSLLPSLGVAWQLNYTPDAAGFTPRKTAWAAVATMTIPVFEGGLSAARRQQAKADVNSAILARQQILDGVALTVRQAHLALLEAQERLKVTTAALAQADEQYRLAQVRYEAGVTLIPGGSPLLEISDAQTALTQAQTNHVNARFDVQDARSRLDAAIGRYAFDAEAQHGFRSPAEGGAR
ncbi:MAG TPA: TolC family protein [Chthonomonadales bacterium]|nr:TolC family protein [Chthonomonadales bacterium]